MLAGHQTYDVIVIAGVFFIRIVWGVDPADVVDGSTPCACTALRAAAPTEETLVNPCHWVGEAQALCINSADAALPSPHTRRSIRWGGTRRRLDACLKGRSQLAFDWQIFRALTSSKSSYSFGPKSLMRLATWFAKSMRSAFNLPSERCWPGNSAMIRGGRDLENLCQHHAACRIDRVLT